MEAIGCLVPELRSEEHRERETQLFEKTQCFYVATCLRILLCYVNAYRDVHSNAFLYFADLPVSSS